MCISPFTRLDRQVTRVKRILLDDTVMSLSLFLPSDNEDQLLFLTFDLDVLYVDLCQCSFFTVLLTSTLIFKLPRIPIYIHICIYIIKNVKAGGGCESNWR